MPSPQKARPLPVPPAELSQLAALQATRMLPSVTNAASRGAALPTAGITTQPGCAVRMRVIPTSRKSQQPGRGCPNPAWGEGLSWPEKTGAGTRRQDKAATGTRCGSRQSRKALPHIPKAGGKDSEKLGKQGSDMMPWAGPSESETSFHTLLCPAAASFLHQLPRSAADAKEAGDFFPSLPEQAPGSGRGQSCREKAKQKGRGRFQSKFPRMMLPPVPSVTNLSFSRNFTFSFFQLPVHQSQQHGLQRQQLIHLLMKQLPWG